MYKTVYQYLTWADLDEACEDRPLRTYKRIFRSLLPTPKEYRDNALDVRNWWHPERCPVTQREFFMWIKHPDMGWVPTFGGPFDSYTIPVAENLPDTGTIEWDHIEMSYHQYDHDEGAWKEWVENCDIKLISESKLIELTPDIGEPPQ